MKTVQSLLPVFGLVAAAQAWDQWKNTTTSEPVVWTTVTTDVYTTFCPESTTFTQGTKTYTATASETLTITDCPCTISKPVWTPTPSPTSTWAPAPPSNGTWVPPVWITTTETVSEYTTYCPTPTSVVQNNVTYTITEATTLTITNCPCTQTKTLPATVTTVVVSSLTTYCPAPTVITYSSQTYSVTTSGTVIIPVVSATIVPVVPVSIPESTLESSKPAGITTKSSPSASFKSTATTSGPVQVTGNAAIKLDTGFGAIAAAGLAALLL